MVRALPSDLARLVLDYLYSEGLQDSYDVFLQESPHLEELRNVPSMGILPLGAKNLQAIVEEYYDLISQDGSKVKNANDALYKLWRRFDALLVQIKHHYKGSGVATTLSSDIASQAVRSRYSLNRLHHERLQIEREQVLRSAHLTALKGQQKQPQHQQQSQQHVQHRQERQQQEHVQQRQQLQQHNPGQLPQHVQKLDPGHHGQQVPQQHQQHELRQQEQQHERRQHRQHTQEVQQLQHGQHQQQGRYNPHQQQPCNSQQLMSPPMPPNQQSGDRSCDSRCSTPRPSSSSRVEPIASSPLESVTSTQPQFVTPTKLPLSDGQQANDKAIGKSPKRKSAPPRRKPQSVTSSMERAANVPSMSTSMMSIDEIQDLPSPWGSVVNNMELVEKLAENINKVLPAHEAAVQELPTDPPPSDQLNLSGSTDDSQELQPEPSVNSSTALDDLLGGMVSDSMMDEFVDMTSGDPAFTSLFALFNTDREKFLSSERQKIDLSSTETEDDLNSSRESEEGSLALPYSVVTPDQGAQQIEATILSGSAVAGTTSDSSQPETVSGSGVTGLTKGRSSNNQSTLPSSTQDGLLVEPQTKSASSNSLDAYPNMVVTRSEPNNGSSRTRGQPNVSRNAVMDIESRVNAELQKRAKARSGNFIVKSPADMYVGRKHVRELSFGRNSSPAKGNSGEASTSRGTPQRTAHKTGSLSSPARASNETTPSKRPNVRERMYSPEEKAVARLLTKLPSTPTKLHVVESQSPVIANGKHVFIIKRKKDGGVSISPMKAVSRNEAGQSGLSNVVGTSSREVHLNGAKLSELPGQSRIIEQTGRTGDTAQRGGTEKSEGLLTEDTTSNAVGKEAEEGGPGKEANAENQRAKQGVKRERKDGDKTKGSKKTKRSKSKNKKELGFPVDLDVDQFLSQITYNS